MIGRDSAARLAALALATAALGCDNSFAPELPALQGPWRGEIEVAENTCTGNTQDDVQSWFITQSGDAISIFFSHREYLGMVRRGGAFETVRSAQSPDGGVRVEASISGEAHGEDEIVATEVVDQSGPGEQACRVVRTWRLQRLDA